MINSFDADLYGKSKVRNNQQPLEHYRDGVDYQNDVTNFVDTEETEPSGPQNQNNSRELTGPYLASLIDNRSSISLNKESMMRPVRIELNYRIPALKQAVLDDLTHRWGRIEGNKVIIDQNDKVLDLLETIEPHSVASYTDLRSLLVSLNRIIEKQEDLRRKTEDELENV